MPPLLRSSSLRRLALFVLGTFALALGSHGVHAARARYGLPTRAAEWIWKPLARDESSPVAFYAVRDFTLDPPPARARLAVAADEEYILYLNGRRIGSGRFSPRPGGRRGTLLDAYEVADEITPGGNRLLVEVRSGRGVGGLLLALVDKESGRPILWTDESWRIFRDDQPRLLRGLAPLEGTGEPAASWGLPPMGRWGMPAIGPVRPTAPQWPEMRPTWTARSAPPIALSDPPARGLPPVPRTLFDFGREVTGYLHLALAPHRLQRAGLLYTGSAVIPQLSEVRPDGAVIAVSGRSGWEDACPRRFRYALVVGLAPTAAEVQPVDPDGIPPCDSAGSSPRGVLGLTPPPLRSPVENEVWREVLKVPRAARREEL